MSTTVITAATALAKAVKDANMAWLDSGELERVINANSFRESAWQLQKIRAGLWTYPTVLAIDGPTDASPGFTESGGTPYTLCCYTGGARGTVTLAGAAADTRDTVTVTAARVNFKQALIDLMLWIADHRALAYSQSMGGYAVSPETARAEIIKQICVLNGPSGG